MMKRYQIESFKPKRFDMNTYPRLSNKVIINKDDTLSSPNLTDNFVLQSGIPFIMSK